MCKSVCLGSARCRWLIIPVAARHEQARCTGRQLRARGAMGYAGPVGMEALAQVTTEDVLEAFRAAFTL